MQAKVFLPFVTVVRGVSKAPALPAVSLACQAYEEGKAGRFT